MIQTLTKVVDTITTEKVIKVEFRKHGQFSHVQEYRVLADAMTAWQAWEKTSIRHVCTVSTYTIEVHNLSLAPTNIPA